MAAYDDAYVLRHLTSYLTFLLAACVRTDRTMIRYDNIIMQHTALMLSMYEGASGHSPSLVAEGVWSPYLTEPGRASHTKRTLGGPSSPCCLSVPVSACVPACLPRDITSIGFGSDWLCALQGMRHLHNVHSGGLTTNGGPTATCTTTTTAGLDRVADFANGERGRAASV